MWLGIFLVALGIIYLLKNAGIIHGGIWDWAWPILIICIGIDMMIKPKNIARIGHEKQDTKKNDDNRI